MSGKDAPQNERVAALSSLSDELLYARFWELSDKLVSPLLEFAKIHTTPSIERSVLMRMGFNSLQAGNFVDRCVEAGFISRGCGAILVNYAKQKGVDCFTAFEILMGLSDWKEIFLES